MVLEIPGRLPQLRYHRAHTVTIRDIIIIIYIYFQVFVVLVWLTGLTLWCGSRDVVAVIIIITSIIIVTEREYIIVATEWTVSGSYRPNF